MSLRDLDTNELEKYVYHYTTIEIALNKILPTGKIKFGNLSKTNDPSESGPFAFKPITKHPSLSLISQRAVALSDFQKDIHNYTRLFCGAMDDERTFHDPSRGKGYGKLRMWDQYGNRYQGICLVFEKRSLNTIIHSEAEKRGPSCLCFESKIDYSDTHVGSGACEISQARLTAAGSYDRYLELHLKEHKNALFFKKDADWQQENEFRWVIYWKDDSEILVPFGNSLVGAVVTGDASKKEQEQIEQLMKERALDFGVVTWTRECVDVRWG